MISATHRFHGLNGLRFVLGRGKTVRSGQLSLRYALNKHRKTYRVAVVVSKKVSKSAVVRNRIRRRLYEEVRQQAVAIEGSFDLVVFAYSEAVADMSHKDVQKQIKRLLEQAGITK